ncbi:MAG TPA: hypothetical protein VGM90_12965 [Kofleriaceae bacterium]
MSSTLRISLVVVALLVMSGIAHAYPQYQLSHDQTCTACHISPSGDGLLNENGFAMAETASQFGTAPEFLNGKLKTPKWLTLGGDIRTASGYIKTPENTLAAFPMQLELAGTAKFSNFSIHATAGYPGLGAPPVFSREHFIQWQQNADGNDGLYIRAGRFMPVFGLRFAEHQEYTRRYGGVPLWGERYGLGVAYIKTGYEVHATGFIQEPLLDPVVYGNGAAFYAEKRVCECATIGIEGMFVKADNDNHTHLGVTGKYFIESLNLLLSAEAQFVRQRVYSAPKSDAPLQLIGNLIATLQLSEFVQVDVGIGHYDSDIRIKDLDRDAADLNIRYSLTSHVELQLNSRIELLAFGNGGPTGAYTLAQLHYRL